MNRTNSHIPTDRIALFFLILCIFFFRCSIAPLSSSQRAITSTGDIKVALTLQRHDFRGDIIQVIQAVISDKNNAHITLAGGSLSINGIPMHVAEKGMYAPYYFCSEEDIVLSTNALYEFVIILSDSSRSVTTLRAPTIGNFAIQSPVVAGTAVSVTWSYEFNPADSTVIAKISNGYCDAAYYIADFGFPLALTRQSYSFSAEDLFGYENSDCLSASLVICDKAPKNNNFLDFNCMLFYSFDRAAGLLMKPSSPNEQYQSN
ncbi:MAG: hypothetical protein JW795_22520 [Chitinivibrionales bacterium]|nr:hypothetical protein [Chitinivibrionales bacterium]